MCGMCGDIIGGCDKTECGALPRLDANGKPRWRYMAWFPVDTIPCDHVRAKHHADCPIHEGRFCDYDLCDPG